MPLAAAIIAGAVALTKTGIGLARHSSAANQLKKAKRPGYPIPKEWFENDDLAGSMAQHGLTEPAMNYYTKESQRGLSSSLGTVLQAGGNVNNIADLYDAYNQGEGKIAAEDSQLKDDHIKNLIEANANLANERDKQWTLNEYEPYKDKIKSANQQMASADAMISGGMNDAASVGAAYAGSQTYENKPMQTMGEAKGVEDLPLASSAGSPNINYTPRTDVSQKDLFSTQGGSDALAQMMASNPNSPYVRNLLDAVNKSGVK